MSVNIFGAASVSVVNNDDSKLRGIVLATKSLIEQMQTKVNKSGDEMSGDLNMGGYKILNVGQPRDDQAVVNKRYLDLLIENEKYELLHLIDIKVDKVAAKLEYERSRYL